MKKTIKNLINRKLISSIETTVSYLQLFGFGLILTGIIVIFISGYNQCPSDIAISFFVIMLGLAFAFPTLLEGNDGLSTMRIVVFMVTNVICMLLLRIGWAKDIYSLKDIGLDEWWMGVIAFVFGAKATQSYFESKLAVPREIPKVGMASVQFSNADIAKLAVVQNEQFLKAKFPNIISVSDAVHDLNIADSHVIALYLKDNNTVGIPDRLEVKMPGDIIKVISTEIIKNVSEGKIQFGNGDSIKDISNNYSPPESLGSICCAVQSIYNQDFIGIITSAHVYTHGIYNESNSVLSSSLQRDVFINDNIVGKWYYTQMLDNQDLIIAEISDKSSIAQLTKFNNQYYTVSDLDVKNHSTKVTILSRENKRTEAFILDYNIGYPLRYENGTFYKKDIILIGSVPDRNNSKPVSKEGDSGSCVFISSIDKATNKESNQMVGILLGANENFTFVLPIQSTLSPNFKII